MIEATSISGLLVVRWADPWDKLVDVVRGRWRPRTPPAPTEHDCSAVGSPSLRASPRVLTADRSAGRTRGRQPRGDRDISAAQSYIRPCRDVRDGWRDGPAYGSSYPKGWPTAIALTAIRTSAISTALLGLGVLPSRQAGRGVERPDLAGGLAGEDSLVSDADSQNVRCVSGSPTTRCSVSRSPGDGVKALVLAGGSGTRLRPITSISARQLIPLGNEPILFYGLEQIHDAGVTDVGIVVGDTAAEVQAAVGDGCALGISATYVPQEVPMGLAHAGLTGSDFLGDDDFAIVLGGTLVGGGIVHLVTALQNDRPAAQLLLRRDVAPQRFGVAVLSSGHHRTAVENSADPPSDLALVGVYLFTSATLDATRRIEPSGRGELEITDAIESLLDDGQTVSASTVDGWWHDTGKKDGLLEANRIVLGAIGRQIDGEVDGGRELVGGVVMEEGAVVRGSTIRGPVAVGRGTVIEDSFVGPFTSSAAACTVQRAELESSVLMQGCEVRDASRRGGSLLGKRVLIERGARRPAAQRFMVGDHPHIEV